MLRTYKDSSASGRFVSCGTVKTRDTGWKNTHGCFIPRLNGAKTGGGVCALGHHLSQGLPRHAGPLSPRGPAAPPAPCVPELGVGPASPEVLGLLAGIRVRGNKVPPCLGGKDQQEQHGSGEVFL